MWRRIPAAAVDVSAAILLTIAGTTAGAWALWRLVWIAQPSDPADCGIDACAMALLSALVTGGSVGALLGPASTVLLTATGRGLGGRLLGVRTIQLNGARPGVGLAVQRASLAALPLAPFLLMQELLGLQAWWLPTLRFTLGSVATHTAIAVALCCVWDSAYAAVRGDHRPLRDRLTHTWVVRDE